MASIPTVTATDAIIKDKDIQTTEKILKTQEPFGEKATQKILGIDIEKLNNQIKQVLTTTIKTKQQTTTNTVQQDYYQPRVYAYTQNRYNYYYSGYRGDCWDVSESTYNQLTASGQRARIIQYANSYVNNHRSVQINVDGQWVDYYNVDSIGVPTSRNGAQKVVKSN